MSLVEFAIEDEIAIVTINRPEARNAVDQPTALQLAEWFNCFNVDPVLKVAILVGAGGTFCAGADLKAVGTSRGNHVFEDGDGPLGCTRMLLNKPVIAAVEGFAVAGGLELALWCDLRVAARDATFGVYCRRFGVPLCDGGTIRLPRLIGMSRAMDMILTGRGVSGEEAFAMGLANRVVDRGTALTHSRELAKQIASFPQRCMRGDRMSAYEAWTMPLDDALKNEYRYGIETIESGETRAGAERFASGVGRHGKF